MGLKILLFLIMILLICGCSKQVEQINENTEESQISQEEIFKEEQKELYEEKEEKDDSAGRIIKSGHPPTEIDKLLFIYPVGFMFGSHVTPVDHQYYVESSFGDQESILKIFSPAGGVITSIQHMSSLPGDSEVEIDDYRLAIKHTSTISTIYIHIDELSQKIREFAPPPGEYTNANIIVEAEEVIGSYEVESKQFGIKGNNPDPSDIGQKSF